MERKVVRSFLKEREENGPYLSFENFVDRNYISLEQLSLLIRSCAFDSFTKNKKKLMVKANLIVQKNEYVLANHPPPPELFTFPRKRWKLPELHYDPIENAYDDIELMGFPLINPFELVVEKIEDNIKARDLFNYHKKIIMVYGYLVTIKSTVTIKKDRMQFGTFLDSEGYFFDTTHFPDTTRRYPFVGRGVYRIKGKVTSDFGFYSLEVIAIQKMGIMSDPRYS